METMKKNTHRLRDATVAQYEMLDNSLCAFTTSYGEPVSGVLPELPADLLMDAMRYAEQSVDAGDYVKNEDIENFVAGKLQWS